MNTFYQNIMKWTYSLVIAAALAQCEKDKQCIEAYGWGWRCEKGDCVTKASYPPPGPPKAPGWGDPGAGGYSIKPDKKKPDWGEPGGPGHRKGGSGVNIE